MSASKKSSTNLFLLGFLIGAGKKTVDNASSGNTPQALEDTADFSIDMFNFFGEKQGQSVSTTSSSSSSDDDYYQEEYLATTEDDKTKYAAAFARNADAVFNVLPIAKVVQEIRECNKNAENAELCRKNMANFFKKFAECNMRRIDYFIKGKIVDCFSKINDYVVNLDTYKENFVDEYKNKYDTKNLFTGIKPTVGTITIDNNEYWKLTCPKGMHVKPRLKAEYVNNENNKNFHLDDDRGRAMNIRSFCSTLPTKTVEPLNEHVQDWEEWLGTQVVNAYAFTNSQSNCCEKYTQCLLGYDLWDVNQDTYGLDIANVHDKPNEINGYYCANMHMKCQLQCTPSQTLGRSVFSNINSFHDYFTGENFILPPTLLREHNICESQSGQWSRLNSANKQLNKQLVNALRKQRSLQDTLKTKIEKLNKITKGADIFQWVGSKTQDFVFGKPKYKPPRRRRNAIIIEPKGKGRRGAIVPGNLPDYSGGLSSTITKNKYLDQIKYKIKNASPKQIFKAEKKD